MSTPVWLRRVGQTLKDNSPSILSGIAAAGVVGTVILAVRATPKALEAIAQAKQDKEDDESTAEVRPRRDQSLRETQKLEIKEVVAATWRLYTPVVIVGVATCACIFGSSSINNRRNTAMLGAYTLVDSAFREYKEKVVEHIGSQREHKVLDDISEDRMTKSPASTAQIVFAGSNDQLVHDQISDRYFRCDIEKIRRAENEFNASLLGDMWGSLNDWYTLLGLEHVAIGEVLGWNCTGLLGLKYGSHLTDTGVPCITLEYTRLPFADYSKL